MTDEPENLIVRMLQEMRRDMDTRFNRIEATQADIKGDLAVIKDRMVQQSLQLSSQSGSLGEIERILSRLPNWLRQSPADILQELRDIQERLTALENRRQ